MRQQYSQPRAQVHFLLALLFQGALDGLDILLRGGTRNKAEGPLNSGLVAAQFENLTLKMIGNLIQLHRVLKHFIKNIY